MAAPSTGVTGSTVADIEALWDERAQAAAS